MLLVGFVLLLTLMVTVIYNDLTRVEWIAEDDGLAKLDPVRLLAAVAAACAGPGRRRSFAQHRSPDPVATFSILGYDPQRGEVGGAVQSRVFSVGNGVLWAEADAGIVTTQAIVDVSYGPKGLALLRAGMKPEAIVKAILDSDPDPGYRGQPWPKAGRQFAVMDAKGNYAVHTGPGATDVGRPQDRQVLHRPGQHPRRRGGRHRHGRGVREDRRAPVACA